MDGNGEAVTHTKVEIEGKFEALWRRFSKKSKSEIVRDDELLGWAQQMGLEAVTLEHKEVGSFHTTSAIVLTVEGVQGCFPLVVPGGDATWQKNREWADHEAAMWAKMEWFSPLWVPQMSRSKLLSAVRNCDRERAIQLFDYHMSTEYILSFKAICIAQLLPKTRTLADYAPMVREAYLAFFSGYRASSIAALIPILEGAIKRIANAGAGAQIGHEIDRVFEKAFTRASSWHFYGLWAPQEYLTKDFLFGQDERVFFLETFRRWLQSSFFAGTDQYDGVTWLNRHLFAHAVSSQWQKSANFSRLVVALTTLGVVESWHDESNHVTVFFPEINDDSKLLWQQARLRANTQMLMMNRELKEYQKNGRLVPDMPTDDGVNLRTAHLMNDCVNDLVRPLRNAGWSVKIGEPEKEALYVIVYAQSGSAKLNVALLFSCGTGNETYQELAKEVDAILYLGPPYLENEFARGVQVHVGPVTAWQPPPAPKYRRHQILSAGSGFVAKTVAAIFSALRGNRSSK